MIIYFTGTGNSRFVAEQIAEATGDELVNAVKYTRKNRNAVFSTPGIYVFVSPIYVSAPPMVFLDFIRHSTFPGDCRAYLPEENRAKIEAAVSVVSNLSIAIRNCRELPDPGMKGWELLSTRMVLAPYYKYFMTSKPFAATEKCIGCGKCAAVCPLANIVMQDGKPVWGDNCTHCMGCINLCPKEAVEYGKGTHGKLRYHGPRSV